MSGLSISRAWEETRDIIARDGRLLAAVAAALFLLPQLLLALITGERSPREMGGLWFLAMSAALLVGLVGQLAVARLALGQGISVGEAIGHGFRRAPSFIGAMLLLCLAGLALLMLISVVMVVSGMVSQDVQHLAPRDLALISALLLVPLLYFGARLLPVAAVASAEPIGPLAILKRAWALTRGHFWRLFAFFILFLLAALVVTLALGTLGGLLATLMGPVEPFSLAALVLGLFTAVAQTAVTLVYVVMLARIYAQLAGGAEAPASVPNSGT